MKYLKETKFLFEGTGGELLLCHGWPRWTISCCTTVPEYQRSAVSTIIKIWPTVPPSEVEQLMLLRNIFCSLLCFVVNTCIWERMYILGYRLSIVIWVYFKQGNINLVRITNYIRIFCMSHCVSYMYKYTGKYLFPTLSDFGILSCLLIPIAFQIFVLDASGQSHI